MPSFFIPKLPRQGFRVDSTALFPPLLKEDDSSVGTEKVEKHIETIGFMH
jgi:hypothetical protein